MASYVGPMTEQVLVKMDPNTKKALASQAERQQLSLSALTRLAIHAYLTGLNQSPAMENHHE